MVLSKTHNRWIKNKKNYNFYFFIFLPLLVEIISETIRDRGNLSTYYRKLSVRSIQRKKHQNQTQNKNFIYLPSMQNIGIWAPFRNKIP